MNNVHIDSKYKEGVKGASEEESLGGEEQGVGSGGKAFAGSGGLNAAVG